MGLPNLWDRAAQVATDGMALFEEIRQINPKAAMPAHLRAVADRQRPAGTPVGGNPTSEKDTNFELSKGIATGRTSPFTPALRLERQAVQSASAIAKDAPPVQPLQKLGITKIESTDDLSKLKYAFEGVMPDFEIAGHLTFAVCPVLVGGPKGSPECKFTILCIEGYAKSDEVTYILDDLKTRTSKIGATLWEDTPIIVCSSHILLSIVRKELTKDRVSRTRTVSSDKLQKGAFDGFRGVVNWGIENNASDITFQVYEREDYSQIFFTIFGLYVAPPQFKIPTGTMIAMLRTAYSVREGGVDPVYDHTKEQDCRVSINIENADVLLRWGGIASHYPGPSVTLRIVNLSGNHIRSLEQLGFLPSHRIALRRALNSEGGAIIFVGVVNSGKTHAIASLLSSLPATRKRMTLEDPVELIIPGCIQKNVAGDYTESLRLIKRSAMTDVLLGEVRNVKDGEAFMDLTAMGTNLYTTTHAPSPVAAFDKLSQKGVAVPRDFLGTPQMIKAVIAQSLLRKNCPHCAKPFSTLLADGAEHNKAWKKYIDKVELLYELSDMDARFMIRNKEGCAHCRVSSIEDLYGFSGRQLVAEMYEPDDYGYELIRSGDSVTLQNYIASNRDSAYDEPNMDGKNSMECAIYHATLGTIDPREIEPKFRSFERELRLREARKKTHPRSQILAAKS